MTRTLLVAFEESPEGEAAFHRALKIAQRDGGALTASARSIVKGSCLPKRDGAGGGEQ
jgi:hypothetical protein